MTDKQRYIIQCEKIPQEERDVYRSFVDPNFTNLKRIAPVGEKAVYRVELTEEEVERANTASNLISIEQPSYATNDVGRTIPSMADLTFHKASEYWNWGWTGKGMVIGVIDSGLGSAIRGQFNVKAAKSFVGGDPYEDGSGHGSKISSLAIPPDAQIAVADVQVSDSGTVGSDAFIAAVHWLVDEVGVNFINFSSSGFSDEQAAHDAVIHATSNGVPFYTSTGNDGRSPANYPARWPESTGVGALDRTTGQRASNSNYGEGLDMEVSGVNVHTQDKNGNAVTASGTSAATPIAVWIAASQAGKTKPNGVTEQDVTNNLADNPMNPEGALNNTVPSGNPSNSPIGHNALDGTGSLPSLSEFC
jgi:hypothetical protein